MPFNLTVPTEGVTLVFGGSGGAGAAIVRAFVKAGANVAFTYRTNSHKANSIAEELNGNGRQVSCHQLDITNLPSLLEVVDQVVREHGKINAVVYACGPVWNNSLKMCDVPPETFEFLVRTETIGFFNIVHATMPHLRVAGGALVACTTFANQRRFEKDGQSAVPKAGIESLVKQIATEEAVNGVRANVIGLGWFNIGKGAVDKTESALDDPNRTNVKGESGLAAAKWLSSQIKLGNRPGRGEELASAVLFMASDQASYVTGQLLCVDGGISL